MRKCHCGGSAAIKNFATSTGGFGYYAQCQDCQFCSRILPLHKVEDEWNFIVEVETKCNCGGVKEVKDGVDETGIVEYRIECSSCGKRTGIKPEEPGENMSTARCPECSAPVEAELRKFDKVPHCYCTRCNLIYACSCNSGEACDICRPFKAEESPNPRQVSEPPKIPSAPLACFDFKPKQITASNLVILCALLAISILLNIYQYASKPKPKPDTLCDIVRYGDHEYLTAKSGGIVHSESCPCWGTLTMKKK